MSNSTENDTTTPQDVVDSGTATSTLTNAIKQDEEEVVKKQSNNEQNLKMEVEEEERYEEEQDEEDAFFCKIEQEEEKEQENDEQPHGKESAPTLLRDALTKGDVKPDDSETDEEKKDESMKGAADGDKDDSGENAEKKSHHVHARVSS